MKRLVIVAFGALGVVALGPARADDLTGANRFICSTGSISVCCDDGECASGTAGELGLPQFLEFDLVEKRVSTTKASGLNRASILDNVTRENGDIVVQGVDYGRAYSFVINEKTGATSTAVAVEEAGCTITAFGACTPLAAGK